MAVNTLRHFESCTEISSKDICSYENIGLSIKKYSATRRFDLFSLQFCSEYCYFTENCPVMSALLTQHHNVD